MYYEIDSQARELDSLLDELRETLRRVNNFNSQDRKQKLRYCSQLEQQIKTVRSAYGLEMKAMEDEAVRAKYHSALKEKTAIFKNLIAELEMKRNEIDREQLTAEADEMEDLGPADMLQSQQVIAQGDKVQDKTQESVNRMKHLVADAERMGLETAAKMDDQIVQMGGIAEGLNDVEYNVKRAQKTVKTIAKNAASDRCIQVTCVAILICIIIIIVLAAT